MYVAVTVTVKTLKLVYTLAKMFLFYNGATFELFTLQGFGQRLANILYSVMCRHAGITGYIHIYTKKDQFAKLTERRLCVCACVL